MSNHGSCPALVLLLRVGCGSPLSSGCLGRYQSLHLLDRNSNTAPETKSVEHHAKISAFSAESQKFWRIKVHSCSRRKSSAPCCFTPAASSARLTNSAAAKALKCRRLTCSMAQKRTRAAGQNWNVEPLATGSPNSHEQSQAQIWLTPSHTVSSISSRFPLLLSIPCTSTQQGPELYMLVQ